MDVGIELLENIEDAPKELLLAADPSWEIVTGYLSNGQCYIARCDKEVVGVVVLLQTRAGIFEIMNVSVREDYQRRGIGKKLVLRAIEEAREQNANAIEIGTGNSSAHQLMLYQKCGFRIVGVDRDYFTKHYKHEIYENGIHCRDMIRLRLDL